MRGRGVRRGRFLKISLNIITTPPVLGKGNICIQLKSCRHYIIVQSILLPKSKKFQDGNLDNFSICKVSLNTAFCIHLGVWFLWALRGLCMCAEISIPILTREKFNSNHTFWRKYCNSIFGCFLYTSFW